MEWLVGWLVRTYLVVDIYDGIVAGARHGLSVCLSSRGCLSDEARESSFFYFGRSELKLGLDSYVVRLS